MTHYAYYILAAIILAWFASIANTEGTMRERISLSLAVSAALTFVYGLVMSVTVSL